MGHADHAGNGADQVVEQRTTWPGNLVEIVVLLLDDGTELIIHAMRMRPKYRDLLP
jgi:hypothetical protein